MYDVLNANKLDKITQRLDKVEQNMTMIMENLNEMIADFHIYQYRMFGESYLTNEIMERIIYTKTGCTNEIINDKVLLYYIDREKHLGTFFKNILGEKTNVDWNQISVLSDIHESSPEMVEIQENQKTAKVFNKVRERLNGKVK